MYPCIECGALTVKTKGYRCKTCANLSKQRKMQERWNDPDYKEKQTAKVRQAKAATKQPPKLCIDCGKPIDRRSTRCRFCRSKANWQDPHYQEQVSNGMKEAWQRGGGLTSPERSRRISEVIKQAHQNGTYGEEWLKKRAEATRARWATMTDEQKAIVRERFIKNVVEKGSRIYTPEQKQRISEMIRQRWANGMYANSHTTEEYRQRDSENIKRAWQEGKFKRTWGQSSRDKLSQTNKESWRNGERDAVIIQHPTSLELHLSDCLSQLGLIHFSQVRLDGYGYLYDGFVPVYDLLIEVDGDYWHTSPWAIANGAGIRDAIKESLALEHGYNFLRVKQSELKQTHLTDIIRETIIKIT